MMADADARLVEKGRVLFAGPCDYVVSALGIGQLPSPRPVEVAFAGRSNVGKSSLINALTGRKTLARISNTPGRTRALNFFALGNGVFLVDMPGYGYARAPKAEIKAWTALIEHYLAGRAGLARVFLLIDARHGLKTSDIEVMTVMDRAAVVYQAVLTKIDAIPAAARREAVARLASELARRPAAHPRVMATSARSGEGIAELRAEIAGLAETVARH